MVKKTAAAPGSQTVNSEAVAAGALFSTVTVAAGGKYEPIVNQGTSAKTSGKKEDGPSSSKQRKVEAEYELRRRGAVMIINNIFNNKNPPIPPETVEKGDAAVVQWIETYNNEIRNGAQGHSKKWKNLFERELNCKVLQSHENVSVAQLTEYLKTFKEQAKDYDSCFVIFMTHGQLDWLLMDDLQMIHLYKDLVSQFKLSTFNEFKGRPKIFLIQACKDAPEGFKSPIKYPKESPQDGPKQDNDDGPAIVRPHDDILLGLATVPLEPAKRSLYLTHVEDVFMDKKDSLDLVSMLDEVDEMMKSMNQTSSIRKEGFTKKYYFHLDK